MEKPRVYDCFLFFRELDMLEIRLNELADQVDTFVLVESTRDFRGNPKPLYFKENAARFDAFADRIVHVAIEDDVADGDRRWVRQRWQRDQILRGLGGAAQDDLVMISDLDEIPTRGALTKAVDLLAASPCAVLFQLQDHCHRLDLILDQKRVAHTRMVRRAHFRVPHLVRQFKLAYWKGYPDWMDHIPFAYHSIRATGRPLRRHVLFDAGWHFTSIGDSSVSAEKRKVFAHDEQLAATDEATRHAAAIDAGDPEALGRYRRASLGDLPLTIQADPQKYRHLFAYPPDPIATEGAQSP